MSAAYQKRARVNGSEMLERVLEPEVMDTAEEAADYDSMDHGEVNARFCADLLVACPSLAGSALDVGTGTALIPIELCKRAASVDVVAIDLAEHMLDLGRRNVARAGFEKRIRLDKIDAKEMPYSDGQFGATISNSIVHHIPDPRAVFSEMWRVTAPGGVLFVRDLSRPQTASEVDRLVEMYGGDPPADSSKKDSYERQKGLFHASLCAALTVSEVAAIVAAFGIPSDAVRATSDRHWTLAFVKP
jgi:ubiquinone/menaquinone biosynthesis C-methylase UbiE